MTALQKLSIVAWTGLAACTVGLGCAHWDHGDPNPGFIEISNPPAVREQRFIEPARHGGERMVMVSSGLFASTGFRADAAGAGGRWTWGGEVTLHLGDDQDQNHSDYHPDGWPVVPVRSWAATLGWSDRSASGFAVAADSGDLYLEIQRMTEKGAGVAAGPVWNPTVDQLGGQVTAFSGPGFIRATMVDSQAVFQVGLMAKFALTWVWPK